MMYVVSLPVQLYCAGQIFPLLQDILGHSDSFRRTWDTAKYEKLAKDRLKKDKDGGKFTTPDPVHAQQWSPHANVKMTEIRHTI